MTLTQLVQYLEQGREIEFRLCEHEYFMAMTDSEGVYYIWDVIQKRDLVSGNLEDVLSYLFNGKICLKDNIEKFSFDYIL